ncbi:MAG: secretin N-terminal domain-containing protein, partial [Candidatus Omnitrophota bacterium]|nr:secretin N-terminal domain-containing protein [Candidatus Omnitrophota bacterium]
HDKNGRRELPEAELLRKFQFAGLLVCRFAGFGFLLCFFGLFSLLFAQGEQTGVNTAIEAKTSEQALEQASAIEDLAKPENVTLEFSEADIRNVLKIISYKAGVNIVTTPEVIGNISIKLTDVPWEMALDVLLKTYGFSYQKQGNIILVTKMENIAKLQAEEPLQTEIIKLKFLDAEDVQKILQPLLSGRGKISVLYSKGQKGWQFGSAQIGEKKVETKSEKIEESLKSKTLVITDTSSVIDKIRSVILPQIDKKPKQVLIEAKLMEVNQDKLKDIGFDWGLGSINSATTSAITTQAVDKGALGGHSLGSQFTPSVFGPKTAAISGLHPYNAGAEFIFQKLTGTKMQAIIHALEEDVRTNTLSAPRVLTLDNQEASILVGYHTPILTSTVTPATDTSGAIVTQNIGYYQEIGIKLNVVPQVNEEGYINMIIYPRVTSSTSTVDATTVISNVTMSTTKYPVIDVRQTQTQILIKDGETIVIGGLLKDVINKGVIGIPFLRSLPFIGPLFRRNTYDTHKLNLLIFITAKIVEESNSIPEEITALEKEFSQKKEKAKISK